MGFWTAERSLIVSLISHPRLMPGVLDFLWGDLMSEIILRLIQKNRFGILNICCPGQSTFAKLEV
jgi:hypothetical protein